MWFFDAISNILIHSVLSRTNFAFFRTEILGNWYHHFFLFSDFLDINVGFAGIFKKLSSIYFWFHCSRKKKIWSKDYPPNSKDFCIHCPVFCEKYMQFWTIRNSIYRALGLRQNSMKIVDVFKQTTTLLLIKCL